MYFAVLLMTKMTLAGNIYLLVCLMQVIREIEIRMTLNPCTILCLYFNHYGIRKQGRGRGKLLK